MNLNGSAKFIEFAEWMDLKGVDHLLTSPPGLDSIRSSTSSKYRNNN